MAPRTPDSAVSGISLKALIVCAVGFVAAIAAELAATAGMSLIDWEPSGRRAAPPWPWAW